MNRFVLGFLVPFLFEAPLWAQSAPLRFQWQRGQAMTYQVSQNTTVDELTLDEKAKKPTPVKTITSLTSTKKWEVTEVDSAGVATLQMSVVSLKQDLTQTVGDGKPNSRTIDSANPDDAKAMPFLGKPVLTAKVDSQGRLIEATADSKAASDRLQVELPFRLVLPDAAPTKDDKWSRPVVIQLLPPLGTGEKFDATQQYTYQGLKDGFAVIRMTTTLKDQSTDATVMPALIPMLWEGNLFFDTKTGRYHGAKLNVKKEVANHHGEGTKFSYTSEYTEALAK
jgi:hypothetical protein